MKDKKIIVFSHQYGWGDHNRDEEEFEFDLNVTEEEIQKEYEEWAWNKIGDQFNWYEKE